LDGEAASDSRSVKLVLPAEMRRRSVTRHLLCRYTHEWLHSVQWHLSTKTNIIRDAETKARMKQQYHEGPWGVVMPEWN